MKKKFYFSFYFYKKRSYLPGLSQGCGRISYLVAYAVLPFLNHCLFENSGANWSYPLSLIFSAPPVSATNSTGVIPPVREAVNDVL